MAEGVSSCKRAATARPHGPAPTMMTSRMSLSETADEGISIFEVFGEKVNWEKRKTKEYR